MVKRCEHGGCKSLNPVFDVEGGKGRFCKAHCLDGMVDVKSKRCEHEGCKLRPYFDIEGGKGRFCKAHCLDGMVDVKNKRCEHGGCKSLNPAFDVEGGKGRFCKAHCLDGMIDVKHKRCEYEGCKSRPNFDVEGGKGRFCKAHCLDGMIDVKHKRCEHEGCKSLNTAFGVEGGKGRFCKAHCLDGMIDIRNKRCEHEGCKSISPAFDVEGGKGRFCKAHCLDGMVDVKSKRCEYEGCKLRPYFDIEGGKGRFCKAHCLDGMVDVKSKRCKTPLCDLIVRSKYKGYCYRCFTHQYPMHPLVRNHKTKERCVVDAIRPIIEPNADMILDRCIKDGCSKRRPDIYMDYGSHSIIIEIDEDKHSGYDKMCDNKRLMELFMDCGNRPLYMIRFNPDNYINREGVKVSSCWGLTKDKGLCIIKPSKQKEWNHRISCLIETIQKCSNHPPIKEIEIIHLFYDED
jgi:uncharacterized linocin/CFP29 family protein